METFVFNNSFMPPSSKGPELDGQLMPTQRSPYRFGGGGGDPGRDGGGGGGATVPTTKMPTLTNAGPPPVSTTPVSVTPVDGGLMNAATARAPFGAFAASTYNPTGYTAQGAGAQGYGATTGSASTYDPTMVDRTGTSYTQTLQDVQSNQLASTQLTNLLGSESKYIQQARQQGLEQAARSGLMTSSIAAGNAQRAAIQSALPIAQQDASRYGSVADQNMAATNQANQFNAGQTAQLSLADAGASNSAGQFNAGAQNQMTVANMEAQNRASEFSASAANNASQFNANSFNQAAAYNANASNAAGQFNVGQLNSMGLEQQKLAESQHQYDRSLNAQQSNAYFAQQFNREQQMAQIMSSIFENPNLTAEQQQQAAQNAKVVMQGLQQATNTTFAAGVPQIFTNV